MNAPFDIDALIGAVAATTGKTGFSHEKPVDGLTVEWYTPPAIFEELALEFDLDPCAPAGGLPWVPAAQFYCLADNGLTSPWPPRGRIWCNPPYGPETKRWLARMCRHGRGLALVFARTDTEWFHATAADCDAILLLEKRIQFVDHTGKPPVVVDPKTGKPKKTGSGAGSMLVAWGADCVEPLRRMAGGGRGLLVEFHRQPESIIG